MWYCSHSSKHSFENRQRFAMNISFILIHVFLSFVLNRDTWNYDIIKHTREYTFVYGNAQSKIVPNLKKNFKSTTRALALLALQN